MARNAATSLKEWIPREELRPRLKARGQVQRVRTDEKINSKTKLYVARAIKTLLLLMLIMVLVIGVSFVAERYLQTFSVKTVRFEGALHHPLAYQIEEILTPHVKGDFFRVDISAAQSALTTLSWVRSASIKRVWPDTIVVSVQEQIATARWNDTAFINDVADVFQSDPQYQAQGLPQLFGPEGRSHDVLNQLTVFNQVLDDVGLLAKSIWLDQRGSWSLLSSDDVEINIGKEQAVDRLSRYVRVYEDNPIDQEKKITSVDLRHSNGFALRWREEAAAPTKVIKTL